MRAFMLLSLMLLAAACSRSTDSRADPWAGRWRVEMGHAGGPLPFGLEISPGAQAAWLLNPPERLPVEEVTLADGQLTLSFPSYGSSLVLRATSGGLAGEARLVRSGRAHVRPLAATRGSHRFTPAPDDAAAVAGVWRVMVDGGRPQQGIGQFQTAGGQVLGSIALPSGDTRYLVGDVAGGVLRLSTFDGNATSLWTARRTPEGWEGERWTLTDREPTRWRAAPSDGGVESVVAKRQVERVPLRLALEDTEGRRVTLDDPAYRGRVVAIVVGGAWCPNCHDKARFLGRYAAQHQAQGFEVVGLQFEHGEREAALGQMRRFRARYGLPYPLLQGGRPVPEDTRALLPAIDGVRVYPTTLFVDRRGRLAEVHEGWAGPATGRLHDEARAGFDATVRRLLAEPA